MSQIKPETALWPPPQGFVPMPSAIEGIEIYGPAPEEEPEEETRSFKCPHCGGVIAYSATQRLLTCPHCGQAQDIAARQVGQRAAEFEFTLETMEKAQYGWGEARKELACESCGAKVTVAPDALTSTCAFCGSNRVLARSAPAEDLRPTSLIPFTVPQKECQARVLEWLGQGWMHPGELRTVGALREMAGIYLPYWTFDADVRADWQAEVGTERTERYYEDGEWKTRTVIDWEWRSGRVRLPINDYLVPGTAQVSRVLLSKVGPFNLGQLREYAADYLAGWQAKTYDVSLEQAWETGRDGMRSRAKRACHEDTGSSHVRNMRMTADFADEQWRYVLLPVYLTSYRFDDQVYQVMVNGQSGKVAGQKPVAWLKVWLVIAAMLSPGACLGLLGLLFTPVGGIGIVGLVIGFILFVAGLIGSFFVFQKARDSEEA